MITIKINNKTIEEFLYEQTTLNKVSIEDYITSIILNEIDFLKIKEDMKVLNFEIKQVNNGKIKPKPAHLLLNEL